MAAAIKQHLLFLAISAMTVFSGYGYGAYQLVWSDEFDGTSLNMANWSYENGDGCPNLCGWGNNELEYYRPENLSVSGGYLTITAKQETYGGRNYTSSKINSRNKQDFLYGKMEASIKIPKGQGIWPAFWMMPADSVYGGWPVSGEIDILESINQANTIYGTIHYGNPYNHSGGSSSGTDFSQAFHVYGVEWTPSAIRWYVDGQTYATQTNWWSSGGAFPAPFNQPFYFILNVAVGGNWPGNPDGTTVFPQQMQLDWVRVYQDNADLPPIVPITSPDNGAFVPAGNIVIQTTASDPDGTIARVEFYNGSTLLGQVTTAPYNFTWTSVPDGCYTIIAKAIDNAGSSSTDTHTITVGAGCGQAPFYGTPQAIPGTIQAEDFDLGGEGIAYHDADATNNGGKYRPLEGVDIENCSEGGYNVGWIQTGEWLEYTVNVSGTGNYTLETRVSATAAGKTFYIEFNGVNKTGNITVPNTGGWQNWTTVSTPVTLSAGTQIMRLVSNVNDFNINYIRLTATSLIVPNVVNTTQTAAQAALTGAGLTVGTISHASSDTVVVGNVISQNPASGTSVPPGSSVNLVISLGIRGDLNADNTVDIEDVLVMAGEWLGTPVKADIEPIGGDGKVDFNDFAVLASNWGKSI